MIYRSPLVFIFTTLLACPALAADRLLPEELLPGPAGTEGSFGVAEVRDSGLVNEINDVVAAVELVRNGYESLENVTFGEISRLDVADFGRRPLGGEIIAGPALPLLGDPPGEETPNTVSVAHGQLRVVEEGQYTIQVHSSDGFAMRFPGHEWDEVYSWENTSFGSGVIDPHDPETIFFSNRIGDTNTRGVISLPKGEVDFEFIHFGGGLSYLTGVYYEVTSAKGVFPYQTSAQWLPLGDGSLLPEMSPAPRDVRLTEPALLVVAEDVARDMSEVRDTVAAARSDLDRQLLVDRAVIVDDDGVNGREVCCTRPALAMPASESVVLPFGERSTFQGSGLFGQFTLDNGDEFQQDVIPLTFALFGDDLAELRIVGENFEEGSQNVQLQSVGEDMGIWAFLTTMSQDPVAYIQLQEGTYDFEAHLMQRSGDAGLEVWVATGLHEEFDINTFYPLGTSGETTVRPRNVGLATVGPNLGLLGDYDHDGLLTVNDVDLLSAAAISPRPPGMPAPSLEFDLNADGTVDPADVEELLLLAGTVNGDADFDGQVRFSDFLVIPDNFGASEKLWSEGDFNSSGSVGFPDFLILANNFGHGLQPAHGVPEPSGSCLCLFAVLGLRLRSQQREGK